MKKKLMKVLSIVLMVLMVVAVLSTSAFATWDNIDTNMFNNKTDNSGTKDAVTNIMGSIISIVQVVGMGVAIIMLVVMAIKYISAAPSEKAEIKKSVTIYIVGAIVLFAASGILQIIKNFATQNISASDKTPVAAVVEVVDLDVA